MKNILYIFIFFCLLAISHAALAQEIKGAYAIKNVQTGMLLRVKDAHSENGTPLVAYYPQNWKCMTWDFKHIEGNTYQLQNLLTNKTFQPQSNAAADLNLEEQPFKANSNNQQYEFEQVAKNTFMIKLKGTDLYITPGDKKGIVDSPIILAKKRTLKINTGVFTHSRRLCSPPIFTIS